MDDLEGWVDRFADCLVALPLLALCCSFVAIATLIAVLNERRAGTSREARLTPDRRPRWDAKSPLVHRAREPLVAPPPISPPRPVAENRHS
jgi:hypothetical protein